MSYIDFVENRAIDCKDPASTDQSESLERWKLLWKDESEEDRRKHFLLNHEVGKGGAMFVKSERPTGISLQGCTLSHCMFNNNSALVGGSPNIVE